MVVGRGHIEKSSDADVESFSLRASELDADPDVAGIGWERVGMPRRRAGCAVHLRSDRLVEMGSKYRHQGTDAFARQSQARRFPGTNRHDALQFAMRVAPMREGFAAFMRTHGPNGGRRKQNGDDTDSQPPSRRSQRVSPALWHRLKAAPPCDWQAAAHRRISAKTRPAPRPPRGNRPWVRSWPGRPSTD